MQQFFWMVIIYSWLLHVSAAKQLRTGCSKFKNVTFLSVTLFGVR
jgi:hypothetical protein